MNRLMYSMASVLAVSAGVSLSGSTLAAQDKDGFQWGEPPPVLHKGAKLAVLDGDPGKPGPFVMRLSMPAGYKVAPHSHSKAESVTVISGNFLVGMGDQFDPKAMKPMGAGGFGSIPAGHHHYAMAKTPTVIQIHGEGPFDLTYVNPEDDPQRQAKQ